MRLLFWKRLEEDEADPLTEIETLAELLDEGTRKVQERLAVMEVQAAVVRREP